MNHFLVFFFVLSSIFFENDADLLCTTTRECEPGYCCVSDNSRMAIGICLPISREGERCFSNFTSTTNIYAIFCPCEKGLLCLQSSQGYETICQKQ
uniref:Prokineticin domain-containing protein n=1 Tax=Tetranychus urticae TaxID=32264 RepID=T1JTW7_TETUR